MQKLRPYVLPGLFVFHLVVLCVTLATASLSGLRRNDPSTIAVFVTLFSQFFLTAFFAGLGPGSWSLRIPSWGALAALSWLSFIFFAMSSGAPTPNGNDASGVPLAPLIVWIVLVTLLLCLRGIPFLKWRISLQPTSPDLPSSHDSLTRGILIVVASWAGVLMLRKDSWPWYVAATAISESSDDLLMVSGIAALVGAGALVVAGLAVSLTLTRLADWMFYRRRWPLPLLAILLTGTAIMSLLSFGGPFKNGSERLLAVLWLLAAMATQPLATLLVMGMVGYRLAPRRQPKRCDSESAAHTAQTITEAPAGNWLFRLQRVQFAAPVTVLVFLGWIGVTGLWNDHFVSVFLGKVGRTAAGKISRLAVKSSVTDAELVHLKGLTNLKSLSLYKTQITDAGLVHLKGLTKLTSLNLSYCKQITDAAVSKLKKALPNCKITR